MVSVKLPPPPQHNLAGGRLPCRMRFDRKRKQKKTRGARPPGSRQGPKGPWNPSFVQVLGAKAPHQPFGLIAPATIAQAAGGWKFAQMLQCWPSGLTDLST